MAAITLERPCSELAASYRGLIQEFVDGHRLRDALMVEGGNIGYGVRPSARGCGFATVLLRHTLEQARAMGLREAWLTCAKTNAASIATIVRNGGTLISEDFIQSRGETIQRYRIDLARFGSTHV